MSASSSQLVITQSVPNGKVMAPASLPSLSTSSMVISASAHISYPISPMHARSRSRSSSIDLIGYNMGTTKETWMALSTDDELLLLPSPRKTLGRTTQFRKTYQPPGQRAETPSDLGQSLKELLEIEPAPVGAIRGGLSIGVDGGNIFLQEIHKAANRDKQEGSKEALWFSYIRPQRAPAAEYLQRLEAWFGLGDPLRGEEFIEMEEGSEYGEKEAVDIVQAMNDQARRWISQIQVVAKGKRTLTRDDLKALSDSLHEIAYMSSDVAKAIQAQLPILRQSLEHLAMVEIPSDQGDFKIGIWARNLVKNWPK
ncbi:Cyclin-domain-containing protein [Mycena indigotica]|uniref:Cyclin-domain-containing protein n=1 Tax=Mycena indigotica TaxID=2126181 RepID=A0A8H6VYI0_9AGAR|nr:Cyclin-domain-containing protein [Mycena indigotica]KAF7298844.1 Cyclin-domain-containing protein [Mycena indigotica]